MDKLCKKCGTVQDESHFHKGRSRWCKSCVKAASREYYLRNKERINEYNRTYAIENREKKNERQRRYNKTHGESEARKLWKIKNADKIKQYQKTSKERRKKKNALYMREKRKEPSAALYNRMSVGINRSLKDGKAGRHWETIVGYTVHELKAHLEKHFHDGMSWENMGQWHIDHVIPKSAFNFMSHKDIDFERCWSLDNLQPMWARDNQVKSNKLFKPHQPSLLLDGGYKFAMRTGWRRESR